MSPDFNLLNGAALAYLGDAVYEVYIRQHLLKQGLTNPNQLQSAAVRYVSAKGQATVMQNWLQRERLTEEEFMYYKRGRNYKSNTKAKNASIGDYRQATGYEALLGFLYLNQRQERLEELMADAVEIIDEGEAEK